MLDSPLEDAGLLPSIDSSLHAGGHGIGCDLAGTNTASGTADRLRDRGWKAETWLGEEGASAWPHHGPLASRWARNSSSRDTWSLRSSEVVARSAGRQLLKLSCNSRYRSVGFAVAVYMLVRDGVAPPMGSGTTARARPRSHAECFVPIEALQEFPVAGLKSSTKRASGRLLPPLPRGRTGVLFSTTGAVALGPRASRTRRPGQPGVVARIRGSSSELNSRPR